MNEMPPHLPINTPPPTKLRHKRHGKILMAIIAAEVLAVLGLMVWVILADPTKKAVVEGPVVQKQVPAANLKPPVVAFEQVASGFEAPTAIVSQRNQSDKRLFVVEQKGVVRVINAERKVEPAAFLDISAKVQNAGEMGLLGLAFHPKVTENNFFYINYIDKERNTIVARYSISKSTGRADPGSEKVILKIKQPYPNHNGGDLKFGPDGYLYIGMGDGGSGGDPENRAQNKTGELLGKMLRVDVDKGDPYSVPSSNPFTKTGNTKSEVWAWGLRNPWRFSFDRQTGDLYIADVGQGDYEEINFQAASSKGGENYGWRCYEGLHKFNLDGCQEAGAYVAPIIEYGHDPTRCSVTGGFVYRGKQFPALAGKYFYADFCGGQVYYVEKSGDEWKATLGLDTDYQVSTFGEDSSGELYLADYNGGIHQLKDTAN